MHKTRSILRWLPAVLWMGFIFAGSSDVLSGSHTSRFVGPLLKWLLGTNFTPERAESIHFLIRKAGHVSEYGVLCALYWFALGSQEAFAAGRQTARRFWTSILLSALYAASDEFHQSFVPSRSASVEDVLIDTVGAVAGLVCLLTLSRLLARRPTPEEVKPGQNRDKS